MGTLLFFHAIPLTDEALAQVTAWGKPAYLVLGHDQHAVDAAAFRERLGLKAYGPKEVEDKLRARLEMAGSLQDVPVDPAVSFETVPGTKHGEALGIVTSGGSRVSLLFTDVIQNGAKESTPFLFWLLGFSGGPKVVPIFRMMFMSDRAAIKQALMKWAQMPNLLRIVPMHGTIVEHGAKEALEAAAQAL